MNRNLSGARCICAAAAGTWSDARIVRLTKLTGRRFVDALLTVLLTLAVSTLAAADWHDHSEIGRTAELSATEHLPPASGRRVVKAGRIDSRLRLPRCGAALTGEVPERLTRGRRVTVSVRCPGPESWRLHVPVSIVEMGDVVVAVTARQRGELLESADLAMEERDLGLLRQGYVTDLTTAVGQRLGRSITAGQVVTPRILLTDPVIKRGQRVTLTAGQGTMQVRMAGVALADGIEGQRIPVRNLSSSREIEGVVRSAQTVEVLLR